MRYRSPHETDHLRIRVRVTPGEYGAAVAAVGEWAASLRADGLAGSLTLDTYVPEIGRYGGTAPAMTAAEQVFVADSSAVAATLRYLPASSIDPVALTAVGMVAIVRGLLGAEAMDWLASQPAHPVRVNRAVTQQATQLAHSDWPAPVETAWRDRATALATYRQQIPTGTDLTAIVESLLHMHHNRTLGINPDTEAASRHLARQAAISWSARQARSTQ